MGRPKNGKNQHRSCEEKLALIEEYYNSGVGYQAFAKEHGVSPSVFYSWIKKYDENGLDGLRYRKKANRTDQLNDEIIRLKLIIAEQQIEIRRLKDNVLPESENYQIHNDK